MIDLRLGTLDRLFDPLDPRLALGRRMSPDVEAHLLQGARHLSSPACIRLFVAQDEIHPENLDRAVVTLRQHFENRAVAAGEEARNLLWQGARSLAIGLLVLAVCLKLGPLLGSGVPEGVPREFVTTTFSILGWAANWRPVELLLYEWWPFVGERRHFERLAEARVEFCPL